jgi:hypothetical protein
LRAICLTFVLCLALLAPGAAWAQTPTDDVYDPVDKRTEVRTEARAEAGSDKLAFTGRDVGLVVLAGGAILGTGLAIRRASRT